MTAIGVECLGHLHHPFRARLVAFLALRGIHAAQNLADHDVQLGIGLGFELAVLHDVRDLFGDFRAKGVVVGCLGLARVGQRQRAVHGLVHGIHALAQRGIDVPFLARIEFDFLGRGRTVVMGTRAGSQRGKRQGQGGGEHKVQRGFHEKTPVG
ncbi:hypothetical protein D3C71_1593450 [compost metagenome]